MSREQASADLYKWLIEDAEAMNDTSEQPTYEYRAVTSTGQPTLLPLFYEPRQAWHYAELMRGGVERRQVGPWEKVEQ
jgi:hypothetical protein